MMKSVRIAVASVAIGGLLLPAAAIAGGTLSRADFERCNQQAMQVAGISDSQSPAASPSTSSSSGSMSTSPSGTSGTSSTPSVSGSGAGGATGGSYGSGSSATGSGTQSGSMASSADHEKIDNAVQAYRDCLQK
jgi:hypothetical protein